MAKIVIELPDAAAVMAEKHAKELGYESAADWAFELLRNFATTREDEHYMRQNHTGEHNATFGRSNREAHDAHRRAEVEKAEKLKGAKHGNG